MKQTKKQLIAIPSERIINRIFLVRDKKVMTDRDLAELYEVETKALNLAVKRNIDRFPADFMFRLNKQEADVLRLQFETLDETGQDRTKSKRGKHRKYLPNVFTEQGVAMLSSVLHSKRAIQVNIQIIRTFTHLRELLATNKELKRKIEAMEKKYDKRLGEIFEVIKQLVIEKVKPKRRIGF